MPEQARLEKAPNPKRDSAGAMESIAESTGRTCATGTLGMRIGMGDCMKPLTNSVYLPRDDVCKRRLTHTRQINLVGLNRHHDCATQVA